MQPFIESDDPALSHGEEEAGQALTALAPIEETSPLGYNVDFTNATLMNTSAMIGMGIFSTPSFILKSVGSIGLLISLYILVPLITLAGLMVYIELASMCGHKRSGAEVVYLEEAYPKPRFLLPTAFALVTALLSHAGVSSTVFAKHVLHGYDIEVTPFRQRSIAIAMSTAAIWVCLFSNKWALRVNGVAAFFKIGCLILISATGLACLFGWASVPNSGNLQHPFDGSLYEANPFATSIVKVLYNFVGWNSILGLMAEVKGPHPVRTIQRAGITSVLVTTILFITTLLSFSIVLTKEELINANEVLGAIFLRKVYGDTVATKLFPLFIGISTFGGIVSVTLYYGRMLREAGRQGMLPFATFWSRIGRFKTPYGPVLLKWGLAVFLVIVTPAQDTVVFLIDLASYPALVFSLLIGWGVWILRRRRERLGLPEHAYKAPNFVVIIYILQSVALLIMPWIPPKGGSKGGDVGFFYATYCVVAVLLLLLCGLYYWVRFYALPQWLGYELVEETVSLPGGVKVMTLKKVYRDGMQSQEEPLLRGERDE
ncbi:High-affinity methionine permease OS=Saccharomyces cerevisiae (strain ATCC 204508 / S288c) GN=MUP1 PE=1 SV=1 [Rhizoctonia solani AG-1 IB]|uniref:High-affinity methionine permease n=1 Tax=Thanatephorus cucumeris (strain AG1-IB / isolate 7/3/14) TaxID=1108050 RepID=A0A0B7FW67_THACB|nr:High-affinity methionine permease OS=Saccharomyces cerevisiae (strain ATCC 204508 / S288c) GN=MUP1 PE=1 SV=1 [Rhizoctonia solani AG-1 IB]